jgi:polysaccharide chain length determinant protein (PEP-CTERM system associated)
VAGGSDDVSEILDLLVFYLYALWKRRWIVLLVAWAVAIPGWFIVATIPNIYQSSSRIYVDTSSVLQPLLKGIAIQANLPQQVALMKQTLLSRPNLESVARKTDYDPTVTTDAEMETLVTSLESRTTVLSSKQDVFLISFEDTSAQRAHDVVQALLNIFVESNLGQSRKDLDTAEKFLDQQIADYEARLEEAESRLASFKQSHINVTFDNGAYLSRANEAGDQAKKLDEDLKVAIAQRDLVRQQLAAIPETMPAALSTGGPPDDTESRIVELQAKLHLLLSQYTEKHPDVVSTKRQLDALLAKQQEAQLAPGQGQGGPGADPAAATAPTGEPNPFYDQVKLRLMDIEAQIVDLRQRSVAARAEAEALQSKAEGVPQVEAQFQKLDRDYNIIKARYEDLLGRREAARMSRDRDNIGQEVQYRMIDPPTVPNEPIGPNRPLFLWGIIGAAIGAGLGFALLLTILDTSIATLTDLRQYTGLPVLGTVTDTATGTKRIRGMAGYLALGSGFASLLMVLAMLLLVERQVGLYDFAHAELGGDLFNRGAHLFFKKAADLYSWLKASFVS